MPDIQSKRLIVVKGLLFLIVVVGASVGIICYSTRLAVIGLVLILIWASARFYYFLFYVLEKYVDPNLKYTGIFDMIKALRNRTR